MAAKTEARKEKADDGKSLGVLYTGYLDKKNPMTGSFKKRFVVLTQNAIHWFKRAEGNDLFGEERGQITLTNILTAKIVETDSTIFELQSTDNQKKYFRATTNVFCEEWVSAIRSAGKSLTKKPPLQRRATIAGIRNTNLLDDKDEDEDITNVDVAVNLISLNSKQQQSEIVIARNPQWDRIIAFPSVKKGDEIIVTTSNGGQVTLTYDFILNKLLDNGFEFDVAIQNVALASSLRISMFIQQHNILQQSSNAAGTPTSESDRKKYTTQSIARYSNKKLNYREQLTMMLHLITTKRACAINIVLSMMVIMVGISSFHAFGFDSSLFVMLTSLLSTYNIYQVIEKVMEEHELSERGLVLRLIVHMHTFTSPDAPVLVETDNDIPQRFIDGCNGDLREARQRWDITRHWRETEGVNSILNESQPYYFLIKKMYPHYHCSRGKQGHVVYYERPGEFQAAQLAARGVGTDELVRHYIFNTEYQWQVLCNGDETAKSIAVLDAAGVKMSDLAGDNLNFIKRTISIANQHYPERSFVIYIVNAPFFFSMAWRLVKPLVHENTQKKVKILTGKEAILAGLMEHIDIEQIPVYYGGKLVVGDNPNEVDCCRFNSPEVLVMNEYVRKLNEQSSGSLNNVPFSAPVAQPAVTANLPPGNPGDLPPAPPETPPNSSIAPKRRASLSTPFRKQFSAKETAPNPSSPATDVHSDSPAADDWSVASATTAGKSRS